MLARIQQFTTLSLLALAVAWAAVFAQRHQFVLAAGGAVLIVFAHAFVLGAEFLLLRRVNAKDGEPATAADGATLSKAWGAEVASAARVFFWQQPFRSRAFADLLVGARPDAAGIVFVHGFVCNRGVWNPWLRRLRALGIPFVAVDLEPVFAGIDRYVDVVDAAVRRIECATGRPPIVVAHSMGGIAVRAWLAARRRDAPVPQVVTIGTPHHGTVLARWALPLNARQMRRGSAWLRALAQREPQERFASFTCYYSDCDNVVMPASTATLRGAQNRLLGGVAHLCLVNDERIFRDVLDRLLPAGAPHAATPLR